MQRACGSTDSRFMHTARPPTGHTHHTTQVRQHCRCLLATHMACPGAAPTLGATTGASCRRTLASELHMPAVQGATVCAASPDCVVLCRPPSATMLDMPLHKVCWFGRERHGPAWCWLAVSLHTLADIHSPCSEHSSSKPTPADASNHRDPRGCAGLAVKGEKKDVRQA